MLTIKIKQGKMNGQCYINAGENKMVVMSFWPVSSV